ncbi:MAG TPA: methyltransferase [Dermatophilaceae bacterium]|nr:methyltransferase [Dermatophilaceae bacterium]
MTPPADHYFTADPESRSQRRSLDVELAGHPMTVSTQSGVFSADRVDPGTAVLLRAVPLPPDNGHLLDLGCGWGPLALTMAMRAPTATVWGVDVNPRAVALLRDNAAALGLSGIRAAESGDIPTGLSFGAIWSNPPIRIGKSALHELLLAWLPRLAAEADGYLVVQRHLGADSLHSWLSATLGSGFEVTRLASSKGYRVLRVHRWAEADLEPA